MAPGSSFREPRIPGNHSMTPNPPAVPEAVARIEPVQLGGFDRGPRFGVWWRPTRTAPRGAVVCVQPLGGERPVARHALASQAWRLAERGWTVLMADLFGSGDSPGDPGEATLEGWRADLLRVAMLARQEHSGPNVLWGARHGALLAADVAVALDQLIDAFVFWEAPDSGAEISTSSHEGGSAAPALAAALRELQMQPPPVAEHGAPPAALFLQFDAPGPGLGELSPLTSALTESWLAAGYLATARVARCDRFWRPAAAAPRSGAPGSPEVPQPQMRALPVSAWLATEEFLEGLQ